MRSMLFYLLQMTIASGILYAYYHFVLRNTKFHRYNRFYILAAILISILIPFINIPIYFTAEEQRSSLVFQTLTVFSTSGSSEIVSKASTEHNLFISFFTSKNILLSLYILISCFALVRIIISLKKIRRIIQTNPVEEIQDIHFVNTTEPGTPFSFFRWLFWNRKIELQSEKGEQIFRHELFHIKEKHSWDILFTELLTVIFWINPFFHLMKKELKAIHEFLADQFAVNENQKWEYAELLLMQALNTQHHLTIPFFHNQIKRRIAMLTSSSKPGHQYLRKVLVLPVAAIVLALLAFSYKTKKDLALKDPFFVDSEGRHNLSDTAINAHNFQIKKGFAVKDKNGIMRPLDNVTVTFKDFTTKDTISGSLFIIDKKEYPLIKSFDEVDELINISNIKSILVLKGDSAFSKYGNKGKNGVIEITTKETLKSMIIDTIPGKVYEKVEVEPSFPGGEPAWKKYLERHLSDFNPADKGAPKGVYTVYVQFVVDKDGYISDIKPLTHYGYGMEDAAINLVKKGPSWIPAIQNGHKVKAYKKQPVTFVVATNNSRSNSFNNTDQPVLTNNPAANLDTSIAKNLADEKLLVIDSKVLGLLKDHIKALEMKNVVSITLLNEENAIKKYGSQGKNGAFEFYTFKSDPKDYTYTTPTRGIQSARVTFKETDVPASFPGGDVMWRKYLSQTLGGYNPADSGAAEGSYKVMAQFIVDIDGSLINIKALTHFGYGMENKVIEMLENGPKWIPAMKNGRKVSSFVKQPVTFVIQEENEEPTKQ